ncbi:hypothetical protein ACLOJK_009010 [Asimina triloba]
MLSCIPKQFTDELIQFVCELEGKGRSYSEVIVILFYQVAVFRVVLYEVIAERSSVDHNLPRLLLKALSWIIDSLDEEKPPAKAATETHDIKGDAAGSAESRIEGTKEETRYRSRDAI